MTWHGGSASLTLCQSLSHRFYFMRFKFGTSNIIQPVYLSHGHVPPKMFEYQTLFSALPYICGPSKRSRAAFVPSLVGSSLLPQICPLPLQLPLRLCAVLSAGNTEFPIPQAPGFCEGLISFFKPISVLIPNHRYRKSPPLPRGLPSSSDHNAASSSFSNFVENNHPTPTETSCEALRRYFSSSSRPNMLSDQSSVEASIATHKAQAQTAINAFDAAIGGQGH